MNRIAGIVVSAVGLLLVVLSLLNVVQGLRGFSFGVLLFGLLVIGLSFVKKPDSTGAEKMSMLETLTAIFHSPAEVFQNLRFHPRWLVALLVMTICSSVYTNLFMYRLTPERVTNYTIDKTLQSSFVKDNEQAKAQIEANRPQAIADSKDPVQRVAQTVSGFIGQVFYNALIALVFFLFALAMGGKLNYWQAFSAAVYAYFPIAVIRFVLNTIILFIKDPTDVHPILGQGSLIQDNLNFLVAAADYPVLYTILSSVSLLGIYWLWLNATGLKNTGEGVNSTTAWAATLFLFFVMLLLGVAVAFIFPGFIS